MTKEMFGLAGMTWYTARPSPAKGIGQGDESRGSSLFGDKQILKFTQDRRFLMQIGTDGYGNHRVIVFDTDTGKYKRHWGAYGHEPDDVRLPKYDPDARLLIQFRNPMHCAELSNAGLLDVNDRVQAARSRLRKGSHHRKDTV